MDPTIKFIELLAKTHYSFLEGASSPEEMVSTATSFGYAGLGIADLNGLYGIARTHVAAKQHHLPFFVGTQIIWKNTLLTLFAINRNGYGNLCELLSQYNQSQPWELEEFSTDLLAIIPALPNPLLEELLSLFPKRLALAFSFHFDGMDNKRLRVTETILEKHRVFCIASNQPLYHVPERKPLHDVLRCIQHNTTLNKAGFKLLPNYEQHLKPLHQLLSLYRSHPEWLTNTFHFTQQCNFSLDEIRYRYPTEWLPEGHTSDSYLRELVIQGLQKRFGSHPSQKVLQQIEHELSLIQELSYADYFLTIWDIIQFAKSQQILFQGRGSAANSIICYVLEITAIDPIRLELLFERFISRERHEPPDIDIDFEHERREEVIQYIYQRYGRDRAALTAEVICFRKRSALREVGKVLEISPNDEQGQSPLFAKHLTLCQEISGVPRHLGTHVGGFVLSHDKLCRTIPIETAANEARTIVQWDKNDLDNLNFTRVDILGLGILTALRKCFALVKRVYGRELRLDTIPAEDPQVYDSISKADTVGLFQIESRAQMNMLPRLKPKTFFDLVVQIAIVRPGPIQGEMVHPYLRRRQGLEKVEYPHPMLETILKKTYGVPLFQEQIMKMAMTVAGFSAGEADELRRAMGIWRRDGKNRLSKMGEKFRAGLIKQGISENFADRIFSQIEGFAEYGFPESHAASFALITYASAYLKFYYPDAYVVALLNSQPMGFYRSHTLLYDACRKGCTLLPVDINFSDWDNNLVSCKTIRLGFREIFGLRKVVSQTLVALRQQKPFDSLTDVVLRLQEALCSTVLTKRDLFFLASADSFQSLGLTRREAFWNIRALHLQDSLALTPEEKNPPLPNESNWEKVSLDFQSMGVSLFAHPMSILNKKRKSLRALDTQELMGRKNGDKVKHAGMVVSRQMPPTAKGVVFITLEDEWGLSNLVLWKDVSNRYDDLVWNASFLVVEGIVQKDNKSSITHLIVNSLEQLDLN